MPSRPSAGAAMGTASGGGSGDGSTAAGHAGMAWAKASVEPPRFQENTAVSFTWTIPELAVLREEVENSRAPFDSSAEGNEGMASDEQVVRSVSAGAGKHEVWTTQPLFGESGRWKLELVRTTRAVEEDAPSIDGRESTAEQKRKAVTVLSIYLSEWRVLSHRLRHGGGLTACPRVNSLYHLRICKHGL
jgi:hypothetical protein